VRIEFHVQPTGARLLVDGAPVTSPLELAFSTATHKLRAEADGYQAEELPFVADSNRTLQLRLTPLPAATAPRAGRGGGKAAAGRGKPAAGKKSKDTPILID
jgi:hypothetical protein